MKYQKVIKVSKNSQNNSETVTNENDKVKPKERYVSPKERQKVIDNLDNHVLISLQYQELLSPVANLRVLFKEYKLHELHKIVEL